MRNALILGVASVTCPGAAASTAVLTSTFDYVSVGDLVVPFDPDDVMEDNIRRADETKFCLAPGEKGYLVAAQDNQLTIAEGHIVFIDKGRQDGVVQGNQFVVYQPLKPEGMSVLGQLQVLRVGEKSSTALVLNSLREMQLADPVQAWEPPVMEGADGG